MEKIHIKERIIVIVGPTSTGKTTLSKKLKQISSKKLIVISHDEVLSKVNKNQPQSDTDYQFRMKLFSEISSAISDMSNTHIVVDTVNISKIALWSFLTIITSIPNAKKDGIALLKLNIPKSKNLEYAKKHYPSNKQIGINVSKQRNRYEGEDGSLNFKYPNFVNSEYVIDPSKVQFILD